MRHIKFTDIGQPVQGGLLLSLTNQNGKWYGRVLHPLTRKISLIDADTLQTKVEPNTPISATNQALLNKFPMDIDDEAF